MGTLTMDTLTTSFNEIWIIFPDVPDQFSSVTMENFALFALNTE